MTTLRDDLVEALSLLRGGPLLTPSAQADAILLTEAGKRMAARLDAASAAPEVVEAARTLDTFLQHEFITYWDESQPVNTIIDTATMVAMEPLTDTLHAALAAYDRAASGEGG